MAIDVSFRWGVHAAILGAGLAVAALHAQAPAGSAQANQPLFTGTSTVMDGKDLSAARRRFEPGARTYWHSHDNGQLLYVEAGRMWAAKRGQAKHELGRWRKRLHRAERRALARRHDAVAPDSGERGIRRRHEVARRRAGSRIPQVIASRWTPPSICSRP